MARFLKLLVLVPVGALIVAFAIANRQVVPVSFDPFSPADAATAPVAAPLFALLFAVLILGTFLGGVATWFTQGVNRRRMRDAQDEAERWRAEARRLREQPPMVVAAGSTGRGPAGRELLGRNGRDLIGPGV